VFDRGPAGFCELAFDFPRWRGCAGRRGCRHGGAGERDEDDQRDACGSVDTGDDLVALGGAHLGSF
jgi:hypothetical protein